MTRIPFTQSRVHSIGYADTARLSAGEDPIEEVMRQAWDNISTDIEITIGNTTMHAAAWMDPDHWSEDWVKKLGVDHENVADAVFELVSSAIEET